MRDIAEAAPVPVLVAALSDAYPRTAGLPLLGPMVVPVGADDAILFDCAYCQPRGLGLQPAALSRSPYTGWACTSCRRRGDRYDLAQMVLARPAARARLRELAEEARRGRS